MFKECANWCLNKLQKKALELGAKAYIIKPPTEETLHKIARGDWALLSPPTSGQVIGRGTSADEL